MKKILLIVSLLITNSFYGQDVTPLINKAANENTVSSLEQMSDDELLAYWNNAKEEGYSLNQLKTLARAQGVSESDISKFEKRIKSLKDKEPEVSSTEEKLSSIFGINATDKLDDMDDTNESNLYSLPIFGMEFFKSNPNSSAKNSSPQLNIATPSTYQLGPGDEISISLWGGAENEYNATINTNGSIKLDRIPPIYLSGYTIFSAKKRIGNALSKIYSGINSSSESYQKVYFDIALMNTRSIVLNIVGSVKTPGTYTLSSMASPLNALYAAGGPNENGSFRNIEILRNGKTFKKIDLYDYFAKGVYPTLSLRDQDVIMVPSYSKRVFVNGEFKEGGIFELKEKETLEDLMVFSGGFSSFAYKNKLYVESISGVYKKIETFDKEDFKSSLLKDGDIISAKSVSDKYLNRVSIEGAVYLPGQYSLENNSTLSELLVNSQGLKDDAQRTRAILFRFFEGEENKIVSVDLNKVISGENDIDLKANDRIKIFSKKLLKEEAFVEIQGEVNSPKKINFFEGMTVSDLLLLADGLKNDGDSYSINIFRKTLDKSGEVPIKSIETSLNSEFSSENLNNNVVLEADDLVVVRSILGKVESEFVTITGLVKTPGVYAILNNKYSLFDLLNDSGGILKDGALNGVKIKRINKSKREIEEAFNESDSLGVEITKVEDYIEFGVDIAQLYKTDGEDLRFNVILKGGDVIEVPKLDNTIEIIGEVQQPTVINYKKGIRGLDAINRAGGVTDVAKKSSAFVVYQNGNVASFKNFLFFTSSPRLEPGCKIVVPKRIANPNKTSIAEIIGLTSTLATLAVLIQSL
ncbi:SLBB domain-containing protein [Flavobacteriaceae bacterium]|nr:SLBB domain-containing protein [Flavobacteriaceae bacterium]